MGLLPAHLALHAPALFSSLDEVIVEVKASHQVAEPIVFFPVRPTFNMIRGQQGLRQKRLCRRHSDPLYGDCSRIPLPLANLREPVQLFSAFDLYRATELAFDTLVACRVNTDTARLMFSSAYNDTVTQAHTGGLEALMAMIDAAHAEQSASAVDATSTSVALAEDMTLCVSVGQFYPSATVEAAAAAEGACGARRPKPQVCLRFFCVNAEPPGGGDLPTLVDVTYHCRDIGERTHTVFLVDTATADAWCSANPVSERTWHGMPSTCAIVRSIAAQAARERALDFFLQCATENAAVNQQREERRLVCRAELDAKEQALVLLLKQQDDAEAAAQQEQWDINQRGGLTIGEKDNALMALRMSIDAAREKRDKTVHLARGKVQKARRDLDRALAPLKVSAPPQRASAFRLIESRHQRVPLTAVRSALASGLGPAHRPLSHAEIVAFTSGCAIDGGSVPFHESTP
jgi:hypothetical protein